MNYRSIATLNRQLIAWQSRLPRDLDLIVGVPRSGLLAANMLALHMNLPLTDLGAFLEGRIVRGGRRQDELSLDARRCALILDDSLATGQQMKKVRQLVDRADLPHDIVYGAVYVAPDTAAQVDYFCEMLALPRLFEWNIMHHSILLSSCLDIDGVLCVDPDEGENDDGARYERFLISARPLFLPTMPVGWLVTSRLSKYRASTERWLANHGVHYRQLVMMDLPDKAARELSMSHASHKADAYLSTGADLFIESSFVQAMGIANLSGKPVFCVETGEMVMPMSGSEAGRLVVPASSPASMFSGSNTGASTWIASLQAITQAILDTVPVGRDFILVDGDQLGLRDVFAGRRPRKFVEQNGEYWGPPDSDSMALRELKGLIDNGARWIVFAWPAFWWLDYYATFAEHLRRNYRCVLSNDHAVIFDLSADEC